jgi:DNA-binding NarL/FixJ family response regulator
MIVDDHDVVLEGWTSLFRHSDSIAIVATVLSGEDAITTVGKVQPDVCLIDLRLPDISGPPLIEQLLARAPDTKIVTLTVHGETQDLAACLLASWC